MKLMKRSPVFISLLVLLSVALVHGQSNPATPKPGSGLPETPVPGTQTSTPAPNASPGNAAPVTQPPASTPALNPAPAPTYTAPSGSKVTPQAPPSGAAKPVEPSAATATSEPEQPKTEILDSSATSSGTLATDGHDPVLDPPPLPGGMTTLVGGTVTGVDHIRNRMTVAVFGGGRWKVGFDERTHIFRNGAETTQLAIKKGERVYVDTMLDKKNHEIFARNIRLGIAAPPADADGQIVDVDLKHQRVTLRDQIDSVPVHFSVDNSTRFTHGSNAASISDVKPGALVHVKFSPESPNRGLAREISIIAAPGSQFTYVGKITHLDLRRGVMAIQNVVDDRNYEVNFNPAQFPDVKDQLGVGTEVRVVAKFEGTRYSAQSINVTKAPETSEKE